MSKETHPSYGQAVFHRVQHGGTGAHLFASELRHHETIRLTISRASVERNLSHDFHMGQDVVCEVEFSPAQFAALLTTMNVGSGTPCTIKFTPEDGLIGYLRQQDKQEQFRQELSGVSADILQELRDFRNQVEDAGIPVRKRDALLRDLDNVITDVRSNLPYVVDALREHMGTVVTDAKAQVEAFVTGAVIRTGLAALRDQAPELPTGEPRAELMPGEVLPGEVP